MGDALSKPAEEAAEGGQQAGSSVVQRACQIQVTPCRVKPAGGGGSTHRPVPPSSQQEQQASAGTKRKALEPAVGDEAIIKRQQLTGLTLLTQCALTAAQHDEVATEVEDVLPSRKEQQLGGAELGGPLHASPACQQAAITAQKAGHIAAKSAPMLEGSEEAHQRVIPLAPFFAAKPISRAQLRQQLQLNSRCFPAAAAATPSLVSCAPPVGAVAAKVSRTTRGQRLLGLARRQQWQHQQEQPAFSPSATVAVADEARMDLDEVPPSRSRAQPGHVTAGRLLAQRRLTQSRCSLAGAAAATDGTCPNSAQAAEVGHPRSTQLPPGGSTPDQLPRTMPPTPATAEPRGNSWPAQAASLTLLPDSALQSPPQEEGAVQAALVQVGELLVELQADSQQAAGALDAEPTGAEDHQSMVQLPQHRQQGEHAGGSSAGRCPDETEGILGLETGTPVQEGPVAAATLPRTLPEVSSNFPGFWCPLAVNRGFILPMAAGAAALSTHKKQQQEEANQCADQKQILKDAQERDRRVRFTVPEEEARCQAHFSAAELQQPGDPTPLVVAPAVFPSGDSWGGAGRPSTLAKSAQLQMPQPPAYSRFGAAAFHRPYAGPQGRRQALMSFVAEGGATCFAVPPVPTLDVVDAAAAGDAASGEWSLLEKQASSANVLIIPRRLQHRQGLGRSLSPQPSLQEPELLEQEVREAYINACLAGHADEPWARLDVVGCELLPGSNYAAELEQLSGKLEQQQGAGALQRLLRQLDTEWQHLRHLRQKYAFPQQSGSMLLAPPANPPGLPRGILKHKSSLGEDGTATIVHVPWVQREAVLMETTAASELAAADQQQQQAPLNPGCSSSAAAVPAMCMAAGLDAPPPAPWPAPTDTAATVEGEVAHDTERPLSPRSLELTPGRPLSRGAQLLVRLGTPGAAAKVQQLLASAASGPGPAVGAASIKLVRAVGGSSLAFRAPQTTKGHMSRGARLLAALHGSNAGGMPIPGARARQQIMGPAERFHVRLLPEDRSVDGEQVTVEVGMEGFNILDVSGARTLRKYPLHHISRWSMRGSSLILFTRSPSDVEDRSTTLQGDETTIRSVLDTLTCSCMQMAEMLQSGQGHDGAGQVAANSLNALLKKSKKPALLTADQVEFWHHPEKAGWMHSQGEHIKTWRKRWFVLKQGFLFRFAASDVGSASKPRGIVDLSTVTDVGDGGAATGRPNSIKLSTATGHICYLCENETSQVEWYSALEGAVAKIVKLVAGVDEEEEERGGGHSKAKSWAEQLERTYATVGSASGSRRGGTGSSGGGGSGYDKPGSSSGSGRPQMISIVNYDTPGTGSGSGSGGPAQQGSGHGRSGTLGGCGGDYVTVDYGSIAGANTVQDSGPPADVADSYSRLSDVGGFGGSYASYNQQQQPAHAYSAQQQLQVPAALPAYGHPQQPASSYGSGNLMDAITAPQAAQQAQSGSPWKVHYTAEGRPYFYNAATGVTQWNAPA